MDYTTFNVEDFASNESFISWVKENDPEAVKFWAAFTASHPEMATKIDKARALVINLERAGQTNHDPKQIDSIWKKVQNRIEVESLISPRDQRSPFKYALVPVLFLLVAFSCIWYAYREQDDNSSDIYSYQNSIPDYIEQINETGSPIKIRLNDGSVVKLESKSRLKYKRTYENDSTRDVYLLGEAFFEVSKDPYKPFIVHSNEVVTEVLGTSFSVKARENEKNIVVAVRTGKVSVYAFEKSPSSLQSKTKNGVILLPNQEVSYEREEKSFDRKLVDTPQIVAPLVDKDNFTFENTPIERVFEILESAYGIEILFNEEIMRNCFITAPLGSEPLFEKLKIICQTIGAHYEIIDAKVIISSSGC